MQIFVGATEAVFDLLNAVLNAGDYVIVSIVSKGALVWLASVLPSRGNPTGIFSNG